MHAFADRLGRVELHVGLVTSHGAEPLSNQSLIAAAYVIPVSESRLGALQELNRSLATAFRHFLSYPGLNTVQDST